MDCKPNVCILVDNNNNIFPSEGQGKVNRLVRFIEYFVIMDNVTKYNAVTVF